VVEARASQAGINALGAEIPEVRATQAGIYALIDVGVETRVTQAGINSLTAITAEVRVGQAGIMLLASGLPCTTQLAQVWTIRRVDGEVFRFTSLDRDLEWLGETYRSCDSLVPSASEAVSEVDSAGTMDLSGAIGVGAGAITARDLYAGLFDGAVAEAWLVPWSGFAIPRRLLKGSFGAIEQGETGFKVEMLGDGAKLMQTPLIRLVQPGCRWRFGDAFCGVDLAPVTVTGTVDSGDGQRAFVDAARVEIAGYWRRGRVTFTSGSNEGVSAEIRDHRDGGAIDLWPRLPFGISEGDTYSMTPGCSNLKTPDGGCNGCEAWDNLRRYGGFDKVPGGDRRGAAANVR
jgi:uncharacterized phage protein (TIGR02218 family)